MAQVPVFPADREKGHVDNPLGSAGDLARHLILRVSAVTA
jgi:hypothetical protein